MIGVQSQLTRHSLGNCLTSVKLCRKITAPTIKATPFKIIYNLNQGSAALCNLSANVPRKIARGPQYFQKKKPLQAVFILKTYCNK